MTVVDPGPEKIRPHFGKLSKEVRAHGRNGCRPDLDGKEVTSQQRVTRVGSEWEHVLCNVSPAIERHEVDHGTGMRRGQEQVRAVHPNHEVTCSVMDTPFVLPRRVDL